MTKPRLETSISSVLAPVLRDDGFRGSGRTFRRTVGDTVQIVNVQGSRYGGQFAINLAVQPLSIPDVMGHPVDARKITENLCEFRRRLSATGEDQWWCHDDTGTAMDDAMRLATEVYATIGRKLLAGMSNENSPLYSLTPAEFETSLAPFRGFRTTKARAALALARVRQARGDHEQAHAFAAIALAHLGPGAGPTIRREIEKLL